MGEKGKHLRRDLQGGAGHFFGSQGPAHKAVDDLFRRL